MKVADQVLFVGNNEKAVQAKVSKNGKEYVSLWLREDADKGSYDFCVVFNEEALEVAKGLKPGQRVRIIDGYTQTDKNTVITALEALKK